MCSRDRFRKLALGLLLGTLAGCAHQPRVATAPPATGERERGEASWYGEPYHGRRTASGEVYDMYQLTAAHKTLAFGTLVRVERRDTGAEVTVRINDRGPFVRGRIVDLSWAAAKAIALDVDGVAPVTMTVLGMAPVAVRDPAPGLETRECAWVQVGAFADRDNAERARENLVASGETVVVMDGPQGLVRVRVGPFALRKDAVRACQRLAPVWPASRVVDCGG